MTNQQEKLCCMICGRRDHLLREEQICLCRRCVEALGQALAEKLPVYAGSAPSPREE